MLIEQKSIDKDLRAPVPQSEGGKLTPSYLSIDHLKMGLIRSGNTSLTPEDDDALTDYLWPIVREIIKTAIENGQHLIVEGCYIPFDWRNDFDEQYQSSIQFVCLGMTDEYIETHFNEIKSHSSEIELRLNDDYCTIESLKVDNRKYIDGFSLILKCFCTFATSKTNGCWTK